MAAHCLNMKNSKSLSSAYNHWYKLPVWRRLRKSKLRDQPLCERCYKRGEWVFAIVVHHVKPFRGDWELFLDFDNLESACKKCHDGSIQREEKRGYVIGNAADGRPVDPQHPWNQP